MIATMRTMSRDLNYDDQKSIRSDGAVLVALEGVVSRLRATGRVRYKGRKASMEAIVNASWLMLADMPMEELEPKIARYLARLEALLGHAPAAQDGVPSVLDAGAVGQDLDPGTGEPLGKRARKGRLG